MQFSDSIGNTGIVEQTRKLMRVDANQWPTVNIVNSCNNYLDLITGYAIGADRTFQWDDTNHTKLPIGTTNLTANQATYSFLTDEQGNTILTLTRIDILDSSGLYRQLVRIDQSDIQGIGLDSFLSTAALPYYYDLIADNIVKLYPTPATTVAAGLKFYFQRTPSYFAATDTTKAPGVAPILHRGFVIAAALDGAGTLGLQTLNFIQGESQKETQKMGVYFADRNQDTDKRLTMKPITFI